MALSAAFANAVLDAWLRGVTPTLPTSIYISLHTGDPGATGANEVSTAAYPAYAREDADQGGSIGAGFTAAASSETANALDLLWPPFDGAGTVTISHFGVWTALTGGTFLLGGPLRNTAGVPVSKTYAQDDEPIMRAGNLIVMVSGS